MVKKIIGITLMTAGIVIITAAIYMRVSANLKQKAMIQDFEKALKQMQEEELSKEEGSDVAEKSPQDKPVEQQLTGTVGLMIIPKIDLTVAIGGNVEMNTLKYAVGHFEGTALPGEKGNFCVAGHRSYTYNQYFNRLDELVDGDKIIVKTKEGEFTYIVNDKMVVEPEEVSVLDKTKDPTITLVTCTPIRVATHRLIIKGKLQQN